MPARLIAPAIIAMGASLLAGCADNATLLNPSQLTTSSVEKPVAPPVDPACVSLTAQIDALRKEGIADRIEKAAAKKYKMKPTDLVAADQLNKANADFQAKCATMTPRPTFAQATPVAPTAKSTYVAPAQLAPSPAPTTSATPGIPEAGSN